VLLLHISVVNSFTYWKCLDVVDPYPTAKHLA